MFWRAGAGERSHEDFFGEVVEGGRRERRDEGGVGAKSHLEARDGAEFHEQHLEFQLHHVSQTHSGTRQQGGWGSFLTI